MDPRSLLAHLEVPMESYVSESPSRRDVILAGLQSPSEYWSSLAVTWLEQGAAVDSEIATILEVIANKKTNSQSLRHRAFALAHKWSKT